MSLARRNQVKLLIIYKHSGLKVCKVIWKLYIFNSLRSQDKVFWTFSASIFQGSWASLWINFWRFKKINLIISSDTCVLYGIASTWKKDSHMMSFIYSDEVSLVSHLDGTRGKADPLLLPCDLSPWSSSPRLMLYIHCKTIVWKFGTAEPYSQGGL